MSTSHNTHTDVKHNDQQLSSLPLFDPFPEPQMYPKHWDGTALEALSRPKTNSPKSKPQV